MRPVNQIIIIFTFIGMLITVALFSSCANPKITLHLYYYKSEIKNSIPALTAAFTSQYPNITIETETNPDDSITILKTKLIAGNYPDIMQLQSYNQVKEFAALGYLMNLDKEKIISRVSDEWLKGLSFQEKIYALPMDFNGIGIIYNKDLFTKFDIKPPVTLSELKKTCHTLKSSGIIPFAGMLKVNWSAGHFMTLLHASLTKSNQKIQNWIDDMDSGKASWADPVDTNALFDIMDFYKQNLDPHAAEMILSEQQNVFAEEKAAMMVQGLWAYNELIILNPQLNCGFIPFPVSDLPAEQKFYADVDSTFAIAEKIDSRRKEAAKKFLNWLSSPEAIKIWIEKFQLISTFKEADSSYMNKPFQDLLEHVNQNGCYQWEFCLYPVSVYEIAAKNGAQAYFFGQKSREDVIRDLDNAWREAKQ